MFKRVIQMSAVMLCGLIATYSYAFTEDLKCTFADTFVGTTNVAGARATTTNQVIATSPMKYFSEIKPGMDAYVLPEKPYGQKYTARVKRIIKPDNPYSKIFYIELALVNKLPSGLRCRTNILHASTDILNDPELNKLTLYMQKNALNREAEIKSRLPQPSSLLRLEEQTSLVHKKSLGSVNIEKNSNASVSRMDINETHATTTLQVKSVMQTEKLTQAEKDALAAKNAQAKQDALAAKKPQTEQDVLAAKKAQAEQEALAAKNAQAKQDALAAKKTQTEQDVLAAKKAQAEQEALAAKKAQAKQEALVARKAQAKQDVLVAKKAQVKQDVLVAKKAQAEQAILVTRKAKAEEKAKVKKKTKTKRAAQVRVEAQAVRKIQVAKKIKEVSSQSDDYFIPIVYDNNSDKTMAFILERSWKKKKRPAHVFPSSFCDCERAGADLIKCKSKLVQRKVGDDIVSYYIRAKLDSFNEHTFQVSYENYVVDIQGDAEQNKKVHLLKKGKQTYVHKLECELVGTSLQCVKNKMHTVRYDS